MGKYDQHETKLSDNPTLAAHFIHSLLHMAYNKRRISYTPAMTVTECYSANEEFIQHSIARYRKERGYSIPMGAVRMGIDWFLEFVKER